MQVADFRDREAEADFDFGRNLGNWGEIRVGYHRINGASTVRLGNPTLVEPQYNNGELFFKFSYDRLDNVHFPRDGQQFTLQWDANRTNLGADIAFDKVQTDWLMARSRGRNTLLLWGSAGSVVSGAIAATAVQDFFSLGGFFNLSGSGAHVPARTGLCHRARHLFSQDRPRRRGIFRISRLSRHVARNGQHLADSAAT